MIQWLQFKIHCFNIVREYGTGITIKNKLDLPLIFNYYSVKYISLMSSGLMFNDFCGFSFDNYLRYLVCYIKLLNLPS